ncbi:hypothetical protein PUNSTDRAFT_139272 [Punctularia strigosozonata HHB-11173 SS5]|uniref:DUF6535 domain-containing protein n=1 Tax=Punctularia strigosozonata (strain HHB-11173) TaxID=741275 RepID=R7S3F2_PUNST|nr:uncharacterized protein PUNSTDRAFT_139272 [Punctularia strigosozonata HHB-11173 SS5]EIN03746.1 hypothetical protein PUNSTDRAFT_139272 [Punctularia strigosozonata HHB-11173 SS5]
MSSRRTSIELCTVEEGRRVKGSYVKRDLAEDPRPSTSSSREEQGIDSHAQTAKVTDDQLEEKVLEDELKPQDIFATATSAATAVTGWDYVYGRLEKYDREMIKGYSEDIDNLLIFAGLFSAVLTAFLVEVYTQLQPDDTQLSIQLLYNISLQLQHISMNQAAPVSSNGPLTMPFYPGPRVVAINALWFLSLVLALASALLGIFVKQWLREYISWTSVSPIQHAIQLRKFRFDAFQRWKVPGIVTLVPGLLQLAVVLFFGGLVTLLWPINTVVSAACCAAAGTTIISAVLVVLMPLFPSPTIAMIAPNDREPFVIHWKRSMTHKYA